jgi:mono/diheme cytochrome c family protein
MRWLWLALLTVAVAVPALAASSQQRAVPGAGWSAERISGRGGEAVYRRYCWACHGEGPDHPGTDALRAKYRGALPALLHERTDLNVEFVIYTVRRGVNVMPSARKTEISDTELRAIAEYLARKRR